MSKPAASVLIRAKDEVKGIGRTLAILAGQTIADRTEVIVVDSGSTDGTLDVVRAAGVRLIEIPSASFTFGGALNTGCAAAGGEVLVALSAHAYPPDNEWLERVLAPFADQRVACACGYLKGPDGGVLRDAVVQDAAHARRWPRFGYSNSAGAFRASLWRERPFREDMPGTEDKEWAWHWLERGMVGVVDPDLCTDHDHSDEGLLETYRRSWREWAGFAMYLDLDPLGPGWLVRRWWSEDPSYGSSFRARLSPTRAVKLLGEYVGRRAGAAR